MNGPSSFLLPGMHVRPTKSSSSSALSIIREISSGRFISHHGPHAELYVSSQLVLSTFLSCAHLKILTCETGLAVPSAPNSGKLQTNQIHTPTTRCLSSLISTYMCPCSTFRSTALVVHRRKSLALRFKAAFSSLVGIMSTSSEI